MSTSEGGYGDKTKNMSQGIFLPGRKRNKRQLWRNEMHLWVACFGKLLLAPQG